MFLFFLACSSGGIQLKGEADYVGNADRFVELCKMNEPTAIELKESTGRSSCLEAGAALTQIRSVDFNHAKVETVNLAPLEGLVNLERISAYSKNVTDLSPIAGLVGLKSLNLMGNSIADITPLEKLEHIKHLRLDGNSITDISVLAKLKKIERLGLDSNQIVDFRPLAKLSRLQDLNTNFNPVDLSICPTGDDINENLHKYCKKLKKNETDLQDAIDPKQ